MKRIFTVLSVLLASYLTYGQGKTTVTRDTIFIESQDTILTKSYAKRYNPRKSLLLAAVVPGLGQVYNKKYWKLPLVYGGFIAIASGINFYNEIYTEHKIYLYSNLERGLTDPTDRNLESNLTTSQLRRIVNKAQRERDFMVILMGGMYLLQIVDAHVDTHLKEFDLNPNLKVSIEPTMRQDQMLGRQTGVSVLFKF
jgi:hypothetical protein